MPTRNYSFQASGGEAEFIKLRNSSYASDHNVFDENFTADLEQKEWNSWLESAGNTITAQQVDTPLIAKTHRRTSIASTISWIETTSPTAITSNTFDLVKNSTDANFGAFVDSDEFSFEDALLDFDESPMHNQTQIQDTRSFPTEFKSNLSFSSTSSHDLASPLEASASRTFRGFSSLTKEEERELTDIAMPYHYLNTNLPTLPLSQSLQQQQQPRTRSKASSSLTIETTTPFPPTDKTSTPTTSPPLPAPTTTTTTTTTTTRTTKTTTPKRRTKKRKASCITTNTNTNTNTSSTSPSTSSPSPSTTPSSKTAQETLSQSRKTGHNAIEKRYRTNLNDKIECLRLGVPSPLSPISRQFSSSSTDNLCDEAGDILGGDGGEDVGEGDVCEDGNGNGEGEKGEEKIDKQKYGKAAILTRALEYIRYLEGRVEGLGSEVVMLRGRVGGLEMEMEMGMGKEMETLIGGDGDGDWDGRSVGANGGMRDEEMGELMDIDDNNEEGENGSGEVGEGIKVETLESVRDDFQHLKPTPRLQLEPKVRRRPTRN